MNLFDLQEQLQENMISYFDTLHNYEPDLLDSICQIIVDTFDKNFYAGSMTGIDIISKTIDTTHQN